MTAAVIVEVVLVVVHKVVAVAVVVAAVVVEVALVVVHSSSSRWLNIIQFIKAKKIIFLRTILSMREKMPIRNILKEKIKFYYG